MDSFVIVIFCVACVSLVSAKSLELPSYIGSCRDDDPNLNECALKYARAAFPKFINGDRKYRVPNLNPLMITQLKVNEGVLGLDLTVNNIRFYGMDKTRVDGVKLDLKNHTAEYLITFPRAEVLCDYNINGRILILPITGSGPGNITCTNLKISYSYIYDLEKREDGNNYVVPRDGHLSMNMSRLYVKLDNLFNGNKLLGDQMNLFMDENWKDLVKDIGPIIGEAVAATANQILTNIFNLVSYETAFAGPSS